MPTWKNLLATASSAQTLKRARDEAARQTTNKTTHYQLGRGGFDPTKAMTPTCDCSGFIAWSIGIPRELPPGSDHWLDTDAYWSGGGDVSRGIFDPADSMTVAEGDLLVYPDANGHQGHIGIISQVKQGRPTKAIHCSGSRDGIAETVPDVFLNHPRVRVMKVDYPALRVMFDVAADNTVQPENGPLPEPIGLGTPILANDPTLRRLAQEGEPALHNTGKLMGGASAIQDALNVLADDDHQFAIVFASPAEKGVFGNKTEAAVLAFQAAAGLTVNGEVDQETLFALDQAVLAKTAPPSPLSGNGGAPAVPTTRRFARDHAAEAIAAVPWNRSTVHAEMNIYRGLVANSFMLFDAAEPGQDVVSYASKFTIDGDGAGGAHPGDTTFQGDTNLHTSNGSALNSKLYPFAVLPQRPRPPFHLTPDLGSFGVKLGDLGICFWSGLRKSAPRWRAAAFVYGDIGPQSKIGEGSIFLAGGLEMASSPANGGFNENELSTVPGVVHLAFPGSRDRLDGRTNRSAEQIEFDAWALFNAWLDQLVRA